MKSGRGVPDASRSVGVCSDLLSDERAAAYIAELRADYERVRQQHLGLAVVLLGGQLIPLGGHGQILRHAQAVLIAAPQQHLGTGVAVPGQRLDQPQGLFVFADIVGRPGLLQDFARRGRRNGGSRLNHGRRAAAETYDNGQHGRQTILFHDFLLHASSPVGPVFMGRKDIA